MISAMAFAKSWLVTEAGVRCAVGLVGYAGLAHCFEDHGLDGVQQDHDCFRFVVFQPLDERRDGLFAE